MFLKFFTYVFLLPVKVHLVKKYIKYRPDNLWDFPINTSNKILNNHFLTTPIMANIAENIDNEYVLTVIIAIRENNKQPDRKAIRDYINKKFAANVEEELIESILRGLELLFFHWVVACHTCHSATNYKKA